MDAGASRDRGRSEGGRVMYVLQRIPDGAYVSRAHLNPYGASYTRKLEYAEVYPTRGAAEADRCPENEQVRAVASLLEGVRRGKA